MAVHCNEEDADALDFERNAAGKLPNAESSKRREEQSRYVERTFYSRSQTSVSVQASEAGYAWSLIISGGTGQYLI